MEKSSVKDVEFPLKSLDMFYRFHRIPVLLIFSGLFLFFTNALHAQLIINEVSQGASGSKEYVELLTVGTPGCSSVPCVDLRGWYLDDNNGNHATGSGTGIASGCIRFTNDPLWTCIPIGTLIVIYNDADLNASIPAQDLSMSDGNCRLVIPVSNCTLLEKNTAQPSTATSVYPATGFTSCGLWSCVSMSNTDDSFQTLDPLGNMIHSVSWGNNTLNDIIYFSGTSGGMVAYMTNATDNNPNLQANWTRTPVTGNETPGSPNNAANAAWISSMNNNCTAIIPLVVTASGSGTCSCNGTATASASGSTGPYTYSWAPSGGNNATATGLCAGSYTVTATSAAGCTATTNIVIAAIPSLTLTITPVNISCNGGSNGAATVNVSGGTGSYTYSWSPSGGTGATASGLTAGSYTVSVTDNGGCSGNMAVVLTEPSPLSVSQSQNNISCNGGSNGSATETVSGGTGPYSYNWSPSGGTGATASNLSPGIYTCIITDANGCTSSPTVAITQPSPISTTVSQTSVSCNGGNDGTTTTHTIGGTPGYSFTWTPSGGNSASANGLTAGNYTCTITDANGCTNSVSLTITEPPALSASIVSSPANCGGNNGSATVSASGGISAYTYSWLPSGDTSSTAINLTAGNYSCTVTDANGCTTTASITVANNPGPVLSIASFAGISCFGGNNGSASSAVSGGTPSYTYQWSPVGGTSAVASGLTAGSYTCTVTDANGCTSTTSVTLIEPSQLVSGTTVSDANCNASDGSITANVSGGTPGYSYNWSPSGGSAATATGLAAGNYTCLITDANGCTTAATASVNNLSGPAATISSTTNVPCFGGSGGIAVAAATGGTGPYSFSWNPIGGTNDTATGLPAGSYICTITDSNGCLSSASVTVTQPSQLSAAASSSPATCSANNGTATVVVSGGSPGYTYNWSPSGGTSSSATSLVAGNYTVTVTDNNSCSLTQTVLVTQQSQNISATIASAGVSCFGGSDGVATITPLSGTAPFTYSWSSGGTGSTESGLAAGTFTCTVTDSSGCTGTQTVTLTAPTQLTGNVTAGNVSCNGGNDGSATVSVSGGTPSYSYVWSPSGGTNAVANGLAGGTYTCTITDANGCVRTQSVTVSQPSPVTASPSQTNVLCNGSSTGSASVNASGGTPGYTYSWSPSGGTGASASSLTAGSYTCIITDSHGCTGIQSFAITQPSALNVATTNDVACAGSAATISSAASGGVGPYSYLWSNAVSGPTQNITVTTGTSFTVTVTDANGCSSTGISTVSVSPSPVAAITSNATNGYFNLSNGSELCFTDASSGAVSWLWDLNNSGSSSLQSPPCITLTSADSGQYCAQLVVQNASGCQDTSEVCIMIGDSYLVIPNVFTPNADGSNDLFMISSRGISSLRVEIYDRWGMLVNVIAEPGQGWDGRTNSGLNATAGTYYYTLTATGLDGKEYNSKGFLTLIR